MAEATPAELHSPGMESDTSKNEKGVTAASHGDLDIPDPDAHLSEAERKAIVCCAGNYARCLF